MTAVRTKRCEKEKDFFADGERSRHGKDERERDQRRGSSGT